ncbi:MAG: hydrolase [Ignavibacteriales bacterium CG_4_9_14_3_um_filter_34_10]|nr:MAG: hydrolase [Ignavibacteriales bacterium CG_4_9_14_3_um_filter_34_10]
MLKQSKRIKVLIPLITAVLITLLFPSGEAIDSEVKINSIWIKNDLISSMPFEILKDPVVYEREKNRAINKIFPVYVIDNKTNSLLIDSVNNYNTYFLRVMDSELLYKESGLGKTFLSNYAYKKFLSIREKRDISFNNIILLDFFKVSEQIFKKIYSTGLLNIRLSEIGKDSIALQQGKFQVLMPKWNFTDVDSAQKYIDQSIENKYNNDKDFIAAAKEYLYHFLNPNAVYSHNLTQISIDQAVSKVSKNIGIVNENERIVAKHDRITPEIKAKIDSYRKAKGAESNFSQNLFQNIGIFIHVLIIISLLAVYLFLFRKKIFNDNSKLLLIALVILLISLNAYLTMHINVQSSIEYLIFVPIASMLLTLIFDSRIGFYTTVICSLIVGALRGNDYVLVVTNIFAGGIAAYTVRDISNRSQVFRSFLFILAAYAISIFAFGMERFESFEQIIIAISFASANSVLSPSLTFGLIIFIERLFKITTDLTLIELASADSPLLRELAQNAPGTNSHSNEIALMSEAAALAIGANCLLAKAGAYYHDIGKLISPDSYVENQLNNINIHENMDPFNSAKLIINHVSEGVELAKQNNLPQEIIDFILMHHGTMVVSYFYEKAKKIYGAENVKIEDYQYPGPKPNSKETAILMLADACQSAVKSVIEPDAQKIGNLINNLVQMRIDAGQLDESPISFNDIKLIKSSFVNYLLGSLHKRIRYPNQNQLENNNPQFS